MKSVILFYRYPASSPLEKCLSIPEESGEGGGIDLLKSFLGNSSLPDRRVGAIRGILGCTLLILCLSGFTGLIVNAQNLTDEHKAVEQYIEQQQQFQDSIVNLRRQQVINEILEEIKAQKSVQLSIPSRTTTVADAGELAQDRDALIDLYNSTNGDNWTNSTGWKDADGNFNPVVSNDWYGITVDGEGYVVAIRLGINNLNGQIPGSLSNLTRLQALYLYQNQLVGPIPHELGSLSNLVALDLIYNDFNDSIPPEFGNLSNLRDLFLSHCRLIGSIPTELRRLSELLFLGLNSNQITGSIPPELGELLKLKNLNLFINQVEGQIPPGLAGISTLEILNLGFNQLSGSVPGELSELPSLIRLIIYHNKFTFEDFVSKGFINNIPQFSFAPQDSVDQKIEISRLIGGPLMLNANVDRNTAPPSKYQWFKDGVAITTFDVSNGTFTINDFSAEDYGDYHYYIQNSDAPNLTLKSRIQRIIPYECVEIDFDFTATPFICTNNFTITSPVHSCEELTYSWNFGDGGTSNERDPYHSYASPGTYDVTFTVEYHCDSLCGIQADTVSKQVVVPEQHLDLVETTVNVPSRRIEKVLSASASTFADTWAIPRSDVTVSAKNPYQSGTMGVWRNNGSYVYTVERSSSDPVKIAGDGTFSLNAFNWNYAGLEAIPNWLKANDITNYSEYGFELENKDILGNYSSAIYGYGGQLPAATGQNMRYREMAFTGFEDIDGKSAGNWRLVNETQPFIKFLEVPVGMGALALVKADMASLSTDDSWTVYGFRPFRFIGFPAKVVSDNKVICMKPYPENPDWTIVLFEQSVVPHLWAGWIGNIYGNETPDRPDIDETVAHSGKKSLRVTAISTREQDHLTLIPGKDYLIGCWISVNDMHLMEPKLAEDIGLTITVRDEAGAEIFSANYAPEGPVIEGWQKLSGILSYPLSAAKFDLTFKPGSKGTAWYDDLRLHPLDGNMQSYVYEEETLRLKAVLDENNYASLYYYDQEGKLRIVKKETEKGIKTISESNDHLIEYNQ